MGFECKFSYHDKVDGEYNREEFKVFSRKIGDPLEDVTLERLAAAIMGQYARRDIFIVDVEVFEISKKQLSFKETKGGIVIKNKKFLFDHGGDASIVAVEESVQEAPVQPTAVQHPNEGLCIAGPVHAHVQQDLSAASSAKKRRQIDIVLFAPEPQQLFDAKRKGLRFTENKKYPVFEKKMSSSGIGEIYLVIDDQGREQTVSDIYFVPANIKLVADRELNFSERPEEKDGGKLLWGNAVVEPGMPDIRGRR